MPQSDGRYAEQVKSRRTSRGKHCAVYNTRARRRCRVSLCIIVGARVSLALAYVFDWKFGAGLAAINPGRFGQGSGQPVQDDRKAPLPSEWSVGEPSPGMVHNCPPVRIHKAY